MQISYHTHAGGLDTTQGYGVAGMNIVAALQRLGHTTPFNHPDAPVGFNFTQPYYYQFHDQYLIGYTPWESTKLMENWPETMNMMDEIWTTSDWCADVFRNNGITVPIYLYPHGISHEWAPLRRKKGKVLKFLHHGEPAIRKCGQLTFNAFTDLFGNDPRYSLTIKSNGYTTVRAKRIDDSIAQVHEVYKNVRVERELLDLPDLISLYYMHDVLIYPSYGEGFGFIPLQAMATGMPVIMNGTWAPYRDLAVDLNVEDRYVPSFWPETHPGEMLEPSYESIKAQMQKAADDFETYSEQAFLVAPEIHERYDWTTVTRNAFAHVVERFQ